MDFGEVPVDYVDGENGDFEEDDDDEEDEEEMDGEIEESESVLTLCLGWEIAGWPLLLLLLACPGWPPGAQLTRLHHSKLRSTPCALLHAGRPSIWLCMQSVRRMRALTCPMRSTSRAWDRS